MKKKTQKIVGFVVAIIIIISIIAIFYPQINKESTKGTIVAGAPKPPPIGTIGQSLTILNPQGLAEFNNVSYRVISISGSINAHLPVKVEHITKNNDIQVKRLNL
jgi:hypothetical protein